MQRNAPIEHFYAAAQLIEIRKLFIRVDGARSRGCGVWPFRALKWLSLPASAAIGPTP
jgi:hypothetical protein